ncbi:unnamed protein product [Musa textilis]
MLLVSSGEGSSNKKMVHHLRVRRLVHIVGLGRWRRLLIDDFSSTQRYIDYLGEDSLITFGGRYGLALPFARRCLLNALHILNKNEMMQSTSSLSRKEEDDSNKATSASAKNLNHKNMLVGDSEASNATSTSIPASNGDFKETKAGMILSTTLESSLSFYEEICRKEINMIKQAVLGNLAHVELCLGNPLKALSTAKELQQLPNCSRMYIFLGHVYAAEALSHLNQPKEAANHLSLYVSVAIQR